MAGDIMSQQDCEARMADYNEQVNSLWDEWIVETGQHSGDPGDFVDWAVARRRLAIGPQDMKQVLRKRVTHALRTARRYDVEGGFHYRAKQSLTLFDSTGIPIKHFFDTDTGGSPELRRRANHQRREAVANDVYRAVCDAEHMNRAFPKDPQLNFFLDFTDDVAERRAADIAASDQEDDDAAA
jgi:hypothetical protein